MPERTAPGWPGASSPARAPRARKKAGRILPNQRKMLERLLAAAPADVRTAHEDRLPELSYKEARELIDRLREEGVKPAPTEKQMDYLRELVADLELDDDELEELTGVRSLDHVRNSDQASAAITELKRVHDERRPPSEKQRRFIADLVKESGLTAAEAARLVDATSLDQLTRRQGRDRQRPHRYPSGTTGTGRSARNVNIMTRRTGRNRRQDK